MKVSIFCLLKKFLETSSIRRYHIFWCKKLQKWIIANEWKNKLSTQEISVSYLKYIYPHIYIYILLPVFLSQTQLVLHASEKVIYAKRRNMCLFYKYHNHHHRITKYMAYCICKSENQLTNIS